MKLCRSKASQLQLNVLRRCHLSTLDIGVKAMCKSPGASVKCSRLSSSIPRPVSPSAKAKSYVSTSFAIRVRIFSNASERPMQPYVPVRMHRC